MPGTAPFLQRMPDPGLIQDHRLRPDAFDHAGAEILFDAFERGRRDNFQFDGLELQAVLPVVVPVAGAFDEFAGGHARGAADHGLQFPLAFDLDEQHAETAGLAMEGDALDRAGKAF